MFKRVPTTAVKAVACAWNPGLRDFLYRTDRIASTVAVLRGNSKVEGTVTFEQADEHSPTTINYEVKGNDASAKRGMHVHQFGDNTNGCTSAGPHCKSTPRPQSTGSHWIFARQI